MTPKEYLNQYRDKCLEVISMKDEIKELQSLAEYASPGTEAGVNSGTSDKVGKLSAKIIDEQAKLDQKIEGVWELRKEIKSAISAVNDPVYRFILTMKYICGCNLEKISIKMHCSYRWAKKLHGKALKEIVVPAEK